MCGLSPADVTLNPVTAYPFLILSEDRKQVKRGEKLQFFRNSSQRFDVWSCVVAKEAFSTGCHYWEVRAPLVGLVPLAQLVPAVSLIQMVPLVQGGFDVWVTVDQRGWGSGAAAGGCRVPH